MPLLNCRNTLIVVYLAGTCVVSGQRLSYGVTGGVSTIKPTQAGDDDESRRYVVGATFEVSLWHGFAVEADFLYRHNGFSDQLTFVPGNFSGLNSFPVSYIDRTRLDVFELPVAGKYYFFRDRKVQPFVLTGYSFRKALSHVDSSNTNSDNGIVSTLKSHSSYWTQSDIGASVGAGLRWRVGRAAVSPQFRYTFWGATPDEALSKNQADFLIGITF
jgi:Outer membrane protein beta-barrel domain